MACPGYQKKLLCIFVFRRCEESASKRGSASVFRANAIPPFCLSSFYTPVSRDLLNAKPEKLEIKMNPDGSLFVQRLKRVQVRNLDDVNRVFRTGHSNRSTASTNMNERSSRSHAVLMVIVEGTNKTTELSTTGATFLLLRNQHMQQLLRSRLGASVVWLTDLSPLRYLSINS